VAVLDTGAGVHDWLSDDIVDRHVTLDGRPVGLDDDANPEIYPDLYGPLDGQLDEVAGHGTFIAGIVRQTAPDADILAVRVADALGMVEESNLLAVLEDLAILVHRHRTRRKGGRPIDVLSLSLGYYHETPQDGLYTRALYDLLAILRGLGTTVVVSAGNDAIDRPTFPASLWDWPGSDNGILPDGGAPLISVGALNPDRRTTALFSNVGPWVRTFAPGAAVVSTLPDFYGGIQASARDDEYERERLTIGPEDFRGGFAVWSGTSFAAPWVAGRVAAGLGAQAVDPTPDAAAVSASLSVAKEVLADLP
jgi:subtilisin family serine protease